MKNKVKGISFAAVKAAAFKDPAVLEAYLLERASESNRIDIELFMTKLKAVLSAIPQKDIELCDLANELGIVLASLSGNEKHTEKECLKGIRHGFSLTRTT